MKRETLKAFDVNIFDNSQLIRFHYLDCKEVERVAFFPRSDFIDWIVENEYLTVSEDYFNLWASGAPDSSREITPKDFFHKGQFYIYLLRLARLFFSDRVSTWNEDLTF